MRKTLVWVLILVLLFANSALATRIIDDQYSDAQANTTEENVIEIEAKALYEDREPEPYDMIEMHPTKLTEDTLSDIFDFVDIDVNPTARYFPEETQREIDELARQKGTHMDALHASEFMSIMPHIIKEEATIEVDTYLKTKYEVGRIVIVVLGWMNETELEWKALDAHILQPDTVHYLIPPETLKEINGRETLFCLLTVKDGAGSSWSEGEKTIEPEFIPSKSAENMSGVEDFVYDSEGNRIEDCAIVIVEPTREIARELNRIEEHVIEKQLSIMSYFDTEMNRQVKLLMPEGTDLNTLIAYEYVCVESVNYREPYGDVMARFVFATPYEDDHPVTVMLAMPNEYGEMIWTPLHAEVKNDLVEITFSSVVLPDMMVDTALMMVISEPLPE